MNQMFEMWWEQECKRRRYNEMDESIEELCRQAAEAGWQAHQLVTAEHGNS